LTGFTTGQRATQCFLRIKTECATTVRARGSGQKQKVTQNQWLRRPPGENVDNRSMMVFRARRSFLREAFREGAL
jgi:hypothetical protein